jgi:hypothetical protein
MNAVRFGPKWTPKAMNPGTDKWALARSVVLTPSLEGIRTGCQGVIIAEPNPTGWFIAARFDPALTADQIEDFTQFVLVRTFLLLEHGPQPGLWAADVVGVWRANWQPVIADLADLSLSV